MELHVEKLSRHTIKPATPTPSHLKHYKLSLLDQLSPLIYGHQITCYSPPIINTSNSNNNSGYVDNNVIITNLKHSLAKALSIYHPLAGRLTPDESAIDCNDEGIPFVVARVQSITLSSLLQSSTRVDMIPYFLPDIIINSSCTSVSDTSLLAVSEMVLFAIQVTVFDCGGVILGVKGLHKSHDGCSSGSFVSCWADLFAGRRNEHFPDFTSASATFPPCTWAAVLPPRPPVSLSDVDRNKVDGTCIVRVFEFTSLSLSALQEMARSDAVPNPTRIEAVSGFIWKHCMAAAATAASSPSRMSGLSVITHAVNMRHLLKPKLSPATFGNLVIQAQASYVYNNGHPKTLVGPDLSELVARIRAGLSQVKDADFLSKLQGDQEGSEAVRKYNQNLENLRNDPKINTYKFFSWCGLGIVPDFRLGTPIWVGSSGGRMSSSVKNTIILIENPPGGNNNAIQAWLTLDEKDMDMLESDSTFRIFAPDPTQASC